MVLLASTLCQELMIYGTKSTNKTKKYHQKKLMVLF